VRRGGRFLPVAVSTVVEQLFAPSIGVAYRLSENTVIRRIFFIAQQDNMGKKPDTRYPDEAQSTVNGANSFTIAGTVGGYGCAGHSRACL